MWKYLFPAFNARLFGIYPPVNWIALAVFGVLGFINPGLWIVGAGLELLYLFVLSSSTRFQAVVDGESLEEARRESHNKIITILLDLSQEDKNSYITLSQRCQEIVKNQGSGSTEDVKQIATGLEKLLWAYMKLLKAAQQLSQVVNDCNGKKRNDLQSRINALQKQLADQSISHDLHESIEGQLETLEARLKSQKEAQERYQTIQSELQRIRDQIELVREQSALATDPLVVSKQVDSISAGLAGTNDWIKQQQNIFGSLTDELSDPGPILTVN